MTFTSKAWQGFPDPGSHGGHEESEVYHRLRDAEKALRATVDILHHVVVGIS